MENLYENNMTGENSTNVNYSFKKSDSDALHSIMKTVTMALYSLEHLTKSIKDQRDITSYLNDQVSAYKKLEEKANLAFKEISDEPEKINAMRDLMLKGSIMMNTMFDDSDSHIADMMIKGTSMGIIEITKTLNEERDCLSASCKNLSDEILETMNAFIADMKKFL